MLVKTERETHTEEENHCILKWKADPRSVKPTGSFEKKDNNQNQRKSTGKQQLSSLDRGEWFLL